MARKRRGFVVPFLVAAGVLALASSSRSSASSNGPPEPPPDPPGPENPDPGQQDPLVDSGDHGQGPTELRPAVRTHAGMSQDAWARHMYSLALTAWKARLQYPDFNLSGARLEVASTRLAAWSVAQWALETGWGRNEWGNNPGNLEAGASNVHQALWNGEYMNLRMSDGRSKKWRWYPDEMTGANDYVRLMASKYRNAATEKAVSDNDPEAWYRSVIGGGYTSAPSTAAREKLVSDFLSIAFRVGQILHPAGGGASEKVSGVPDFATAHWDELVKLAGGDEVTAKEALAAWAMASWFGDRPVRLTSESRFESFDPSEVIPPGRETPTAAHYLSGLLSSKLLQQTAGGTWWDQWTGPNLSGLGKLVWHNPSGATPIPAQANLDNALVELGAALGK